MADVVIAALAAACCVYFASASAKLRDRASYRHFLTGLRDTDLIPDRMLGAMAVALVTCEALVALGAAAAAVMDAARRDSPAAVTVPVLGLAAALTCVLAAGIAVVVRRGTQAQCACFGPASGGQLGRPHLARNLALLTFLVTAIACTLAGHDRASGAGIVLAVITGAVAGLLLIRFDDLIDLFAPVSERSAG